MTTGMPWFQSGSENGFDIKLNNSDGRYVASYLYPAFPIHGLKVVNKTEEIQILPR